MRMAGENQIESAAKTIRHLRIMHQQNLARGLWSGESVNAPPAKTDELQIVCLQDRSAVRQPAAAGCGKSIRKIGEGDAALVIMSYGGAVDWGCDLANGCEGG